MAKIRRVHFGQKPRWNHTPKGERTVWNSASIQEQSVRSQFRQTDETSSQEVQHEGGARITATSPTYLQATDEHQSIYPLLAIS